MKHTIKSLAALLMAGAMMTSCIDTEVSPEVKNLRASQAAYVQAQADLAAAEAAAQVILNTYTAAMNTMTLATQEATLRAKVAEVDAAVKQSEYALKLAEIDLAESVADLEKMIAEKGLDDAMDYLDDYQGAVSTLNGMVGSQIVAEANLAKAEMVLANPNDTTEILLDYYEGERAKVAAELAAEEAALVMLEEVAAAPEEVTTTLAEAKAELASLEVQESFLYETSNQVGAEADIADELWSNAYDIINDYTNLINSIPSETQDIVSAQAAVTADNALIASEKAELVVYQANLTSAKTALTPMETTVVTKKATLDTKVNALAAAQSAYEIAQNNFEADPSAVNTTARDNALTAKNTAQTEKNTAQTEYNTAVTNRNDALNQVNNAQSVVDSQVIYINNLEQDLVEDASYVLEEQAELALVVSQSTALKVSYDAAKLNIGVLYADAQAKYAESDSLDALYTYVSGLSSNVGDVVDALENHLDELVAIIAAKKTSIETLRHSVASYDDLLADQMITKAEQEEDVAFKTAEVSRIEAEIAAQQSIVDKIKALLDAAIAG